MCEQSAENVIQLVDLGAACMETRQLAPVYIVCDSMWAHMNHRPEGCNVERRDHRFLGRYAKRLHDGRQTSSQTHP